MKFINKLRRFAGEFFLKREQSSFSRERSFSGFSNAQTIGILFNATNAEDHELVKKYVRYLKENRKKVKAIGFFSKGDIPDVVYSKIEFDFFSTKNINWYLHPRKGFIKNFIAENFDILIYLNIYNDFPLKYISSLSKAKFKIGAYSPADERYDLMIDTGNNRGLKFLLRNVDSYMQQMEPQKKTA